MKYISRGGYLTTFKICKGPFWKEEIVYLFIYLCQHKIFIPLLLATFKDAFSPFSYACLEKIYKFYCLDVSVEEDLVWP